MDDILHILFHPTCVPVGLQTQPGLTLGKTPVQRVHLKQEVLCFLSLSLCLQAQTAPFTHSE